jgi:hypothetical protein
MPGAYLDAWKEFRRREYLLIGSMVGFLVMPLAVWQLMSPRYWRDLSGGSLVLVFLFSFPVCYWRLVIWPCPRCGKMFRSFSSDKCRHCGLPIYAEDDPGA